MRILIVDDRQENRLLLKRLLEKAGYSALFEAGSAEEAFQFLHLNQKETDPDASVDLILMDILMPGIDGIEACRRIKHQNRFHDVPVIMVTAMTDMESLQKAFTAGAVDYITKPLKKVELQARIRSALTLKKETDRRKAREKEISQIGSLIQKKLLAGSPPEGMEGFRVAAWNMPSERIDGDFHDFFRYSPTVMDVIIADVMGKGLPAALMGAAAKTQFFRTITRLTAETTQAGIPNPHRIVQDVHAKMTPELIELNAFITLCYARVDSQLKRVDWVDCGHTKTIHFHGGTGKTTLLTGDNVPLGFDSGEKYRQQSVMMDEGDVLFFYSDGVTESRNDKGELFGESRLRDLIHGKGFCSPQEILDSVKQELAAFSSSKQIPDDITCVVIAFGKPGATIQCSIDRLCISADENKLADVRAFVHHFCTEMAGLSHNEHLIWKMELAVHEAAVNIIKHALKNDYNRTFSIEAKVESEILIFRLRYDGKPFIPEGAPSLPTDPYSESGYGLYILTQYFDEVDHGSSGDGLNSLVLKKTIPKDYHSEHKSDNSSTY